MEHALKRSHRINRMSRVLYPSSGFLSSAPWPKKHYNGLINQSINPYHVSCSSFFMNFIDEFILFISHCIYEINLFISIWIDEFFFSSVVALLSLLFSPVFALMMLFFISSDVDDTTEGDTDITKDSDTDTDGNKSVNGIITTKAGLLWYHLVRLQFAMCQCKSVNDYNVQNMRSFNNMLNIWSVYIFIIKVPIDIYKISVRPKVWMSIMCKAWDLSTICKISDQFTLIIKVPVDIKNQ